MKLHKSLFTILLASVLLLTLDSCGFNSEKQGNDDENLLQDEPNMDSVIDTMVYDTEAHDPNPLPEEMEESRSEVKETAKAVPPAKPAAQKKETLYISTHAAQGEVYGSVTMTGNKGRGTIHDEHENTLSISVTRHGNELFGVDQNGRQYVFKI